MVELLNNSAGFEVEPIWDYTHSQLARQGIAWVGVTYDPPAVGFLKQWNQQRYAPWTGGSQIRVRSGTSSPSLAA